MNSYDKRWWQHYNLTFFPTWFSQVNILRGFFAWRHSHQTGDKRFETIWAMENHRNHTYHDDPYREFQYADLVKTVKSLGASLFVLHKPPDLPILHSSDIRCFRSTTLSQNHCSFQMTEFWKEVFETTVLNPLVSSRIALNFSCNENKRSR